MSDFEKHLNKTAKQFIQKAHKRQTRGLQKIGYNAAVLSIYGLQIAIPVLICIFVGGILDQTYPHPQLVWTLNFVIIGFIIGIVNATVWLKNSYQNRRNK